MVYRAFFLFLTGKLKKKGSEYMERLEIGRFTATTFNERTIDFIVFDDNTIDCPSLNIESYNMIEIKPRFVLWNGNGRYTYGRYSRYEGYRSYIDSDPQTLVAKYNIDEDLFAYLKQREMISYSTEMAMYYGFSDTKGRNDDDIKRPYKKALKKGIAFEKQRKGQFN